MPRIGMRSLPVTNTEKATFYFQCEQRILTIIPGIKMSFTGGISVGTHRGIVSSSLEEDCGTLPRRA